MPLLNEPFCQPFNNAIHKVKWEIHKASLLEKSGSAFYCALKEASLTSCSSSFRAFLFILTPVKWTQGWVPWEVYRERKDLHRHRWVIFICFPVLSSVKMERGRSAVSTTSTRQECKAFSQLFRLACFLSLPFKGSIVLFFSHRCFSSLNSLQILQEQPLVDTQASHLANSRLYKNPSVHQTSGRILGGWSHSPAPFPTELPQQSSVLLPRSRLWLWLSVQGFHPDHWFRITVVHWNHLIMPVLQLPGFPLVGRVCGSKVKPAWEPQILVLMEQLRSWDGLEAPVDSKPSFPDLVVATLEPCPPHYA